jgi:hypothetical protein
MHIIIKFLSSRWPESMLRSSHLMLGQGKRHFGCWISQSQLSWFSKLAKLTWLTFSNLTMDFTIAFLSSSWSKNIYRTSNLGSGWRSYAPGKMLCCRNFQPKLELLAHTRARTSGSSLNFRPTLEPELLANLIKRLFRSCLLDFDPNCSKLVGNLENKPWRGFLLG